MKRIVAIMAVVVFSTAMAQSPTEVLKAGFEKFNSGDIKGAIKYFTKAIELDPTLSVAYTNRGVCHAILGNWDKAADDLSRAVELDPTNSFAYFHLAYVLNQMGMVQEAYQMLYLALQYDPQVMIKRGSYLSAPVAPVVKRFYAMEYIFASSYLPAPAQYMAMANSIISQPAPKAQPPQKQTTTMESKPEKKREPEKRCVPAYPNRYMMAVVVWKYESLSPLDFAKRDIPLIERLATCYMGIPKRNFTLLENPSIGRLRRELRRFASRVDKRDAVAVFYYSGHGIVDTKGELFLLPRDASVETEEDLKETALPLTELKEKLSRAKGMKLAMIDACRVKVPWKPAVLFIRKKEKEKDMAVLFSTAPGKISMGKESSVFLSVLYRMASRGIENLDMDGSGYVELKELIRPLRVQVKKAPMNQQIPEATGTPRL